MKFKPYEEYKKVDLPWIDEIPSHWEESRIKQVFKVQNGYGFPIEFQGNEFGEYPFLKVSDINKKGKYVSIAKNYIDNEILLQQNYKLIPKGSIIIAKIGEALKKNHRKINKVKCLIDNNLQAMVPYQYNNLDFLYYILKIIDMDWFNNGGTIPSINNNKLLSYSIFLPPKEEQDKIADFLDHTLDKIDKFVKLTERQIELLKEQKEVLINDAITKGIDKNVEYKDSGIDWIGEIPEHWEVTRLKYILKNQTEKDRVLKDNQVYIGLANIESKTGNIIGIDNDIKIQSDSPKFKEGDILFGKLRPYLSKVAIARNDGLCSGEILVLRKRTSIVFKKYIFYRLLSYNFISIVNSSTYGSKMPRAEWSFIGSLKITIPPKKEQEEIVAYIEKETNKIDRTIELYKNQIELIKEYRTSLIASAVTGKIDVRDF